MHKESIINFRKIKPGSLIQVSKGTTRVECIVLNRNHGKITMFVIRYVNNSPEGERTQTFNYAVLRKELGTVEKLNIIY